MAAPHVQTWRANRQVPQDRFNLLQGVPGKHNPLSLQSLGLRWATGPMTLATHSLEVKTDHAFQRLKMPLLSDVTKAIEESACVSNLRCFSFQAKLNSASEAAVAFIVDLQIWIIGRAPHIEALRLLESKPGIATCALGLQHLRHLEMEAHAFVEGVSELHGQLLPCLETLFLHDEGQMHAVINVLGCPRLMHLVVEGRYAQHVLQGPNCQLGLHVHRAEHDHNLWQRSNSVNPAVLRQSLEATRELDLTLPRYCPYVWDANPNASVHFASLETLRVNQSFALGPNRPLTHGGAGNILKNCMPINGQPLKGLKSLIIVADGAMECCIPEALPNLEELILFGKGPAEVTFESSRATLSTVKSFYIFGQPLRLDIFGHEMHILQVFMARRGMLLSVASPKKAAQNFNSYRNHSYCMYVRPDTAQEPSFEELYDKVSELARQCRCKACFDCLRRAGCLTWC